MIPALSHGRWPRGLKYTVAVQTDPAYPQILDERIVPLSGTRVKWFEPTEDHELPERLREVATGLSDPVEFADEYGLLGYAQLHRWEGIPSPEMGGPLQMGEGPLKLLMAEDPKFARDLN